MLGEKDTKKIEKNKNQFLNKNISTFIFKNYAISHELKVKIYVSSH